MNFKEARNKTAQLKELAQSILFTLATCEGSDSERHFGNYLKEAESNASSLLEGITAMKSEIYGIDAP